MSGAKKSRYVVEITHSKLFSFARVVDTKTGRGMGAADSFRDGDRFRELCEIQARALNDTLDRPTTAQDRRDEHE